MLSILGRRQRTCQGWSRRRLLQAGGAGLFGMSLPRLLAAESTGDLHEPRARSVIFLLLFGGPSQLETFDMKPEAADTIRGPFVPIDSRTPGLRICEHLPLLAETSDRFTVVKTLSHSYNDHSGGGHYIQTGHRWNVPIGGGFNVTPNDWPSMGSVVDCLTQQSHGLPSHAPHYAVLPNSLGRIQEYNLQLRRPGETAGWLGRRYDPLTTKIDKRDKNDNPYWRDCADEELTFQIQGMHADEALTLDRLDRRRSLLTQFDDARSALADASASTYGQFQQRALSLVTSPQTREALDVTREPATLRDRYGRHLFGQSVLTARRLVEAGTRFVTVHYDCVDGYSWDSHVHSTDVKNHLLPTLDQALSALLLDLEERGLLDETLIVCLGEMGRTPQANKTWGRGHWSTLFPAVLAGAGIRGGTIHGETDADAAYAITPPHSPEDLAATIYHTLGISSETRLPGRDGRPMFLTDGGEVIRGLFG
ncbi:MAG: DUF1501 domain-containing protein [Planctomycetaceae bacterium]|nr:DUF1501 domain-containing protein [Planctomycetaceae bacterium]